MPGGQESLHRLQRDGPFRLPATRTDGLDNLEGETDDGLISAALMPFSPVTVLLSVPRTVFLSDRPQTS
jgi:hypothetical protein